MKNSILKRIKQVFTEIPESDNRAKVGPRDFVVTLVLSLVTDSNSRSLESLRRCLISKTAVRLCRSSFWQRMSSKRLLHMLEIALAQLISATSSQLGVNKQILSAMGVKRIFFQDSSSIKLPKGASKTFPGPRSNNQPARIKVHSCLDLFSGTIRWHTMTPAVEHDRRSFPPIKLLRGCLIIFDLGYWDYGLFSMLTSQGAYFLSRIKENAIVEIIDVGKSKSNSSKLGKFLFNYKWNRNQGIVEFVGKFGKGKNSGLEARVIGFWNPCNKSYHWYLTNLSVDAKLIYPLYRLRWQVELSFKAAKSTFKLDEISSSNSNIIRSLCILSSIAYLLSQPIARASVEKCEDIKKKSLSNQRSAFVFVHICTELRKYILEGGQSALASLVNKISLYTQEFFDPNYKKRISSLQRVALCL